MGMLVKLPNTIGMICVTITILLTVYGQVVLKWRVALYPPLPDGAQNVLIHLFKLSTTPWVASALIAYVLAVGSWMVALTKFELSAAYPFMSLSFVGVAMLSVMLLGETMNMAQVMGLSLVVLGLVIGSQV